jgi:preprotein translocase SecF subunit
MFNFVQRRKWYYLFSGVLILISFVAMGISVATYPEHTPIRLSIDFLGGSLFEFQFDPGETAQDSDSITESILASVFTQAGFEDVRIQRLGELNSNANNRWQVRTRFSTEEETARIKTALDQTARSVGLQLNTGTMQVNQVSPSIGGEVGRVAVVAIIVGTIVVTGFIVFAFRQVPNAQRYGVCAIAAMFHDIIILIGTMSVLGLLFGWEADALFITAVLTVVAYSVQDSIVVFDRIRENIAARRGEPYELIVNRSILETVVRSITTQILIGMVLFSLILVGGASIRVFVTVLLIGLISGTYSSLFIGIPLLVTWGERKALAAAR